jgi:predicted nucleic acid-binding protein
MAAAGARGNLASDAQIAAVCREHGVESLLTLDFPGVRIVDVAETP